MIITKDILDETLRLGLGEIPLEGLVRLRDHLAAGGDILLGGKVGVIRDGRAVF